MKVFVIWRSGGSEMEKFDFMGFGIEGRYDEMFVACASKYTPAETIDLCMREFEYKFKPLTWCGRTIPALRAPSVDDVQSAYCAFRFGVSPEWPDGCYTLVGKGETGAFPVWVIDFTRLKEDGDSG